MGNEFSAADFAPHLIYPLQFHANILETNVSTLKLTFSEGGHHPKLRLRKATTIRTDTVNDTTGGILVVKHGANTAVTITEGATTDPIGHVTEGTIVDMYKDVDVDEVIEAYFSTAPGASGLMLFLEYELIA